MCSLLNAIYLIGKPFKNQSENKIQLGEEIGIIIILYPVMVFINPECNDTVREWSGYIFIFTLVAIAFCNLMIPIKEAVVGGCMFCWEYFRSKDTTNEQIVKHYELLVSKYPGKYQNFEEFIELNNAIKQVYEWTPFRNWLIKYGFDLEKFEEEQTFNQNRA